MFDDLIYFVLNKLTFSNSVRETAKVAFIKFILDF